MSMTLRLDDEHDAALTALAKAEGVSKNEAALRAIVDKLERLSRESVVETALQDTITRYASTLKRLGE
jgi:predicted transcriptional regulator